MKQGKIRKDIRTHEMVNIQSLVEIKDFKSHKSEMEKSFNRMTEKISDFGIIKFSTKNCNGENLMLYSKVNSMLKLTDYIKTLLKNPSILNDGLTSGSYDFWWDTEKDFVLFIGEENDAKIYRVFRDIKCF